jgi:hypothetical protein
VTFSLLHPLFAWLLPLAAAPVIFHLFFRVKKRPRPFPTLMFFHSIDPRLSARRKIMEWIILLLRTLLILFLLLALARPVWFGAGQGGTMAAVLVLDNSGSMSGRAPDGKTKLSSALAAAEALVGALKEKDSAAIVLLVDDPAVPLPPGLVADKAALRAALARVKETEGTGVPARALDRAAALVATSAATHYEVHVLSDLQEIEWNKAASLKAPRTGTQFRVHKIATAPDNGPNVSLLAARLPPRKVLAGRKLAVAVDLSNPTDAEARGRLNWADDAGNKGLVDVTIAARSEHTQPVILEAPAPGFHWVNVWFEGDNFAADNRAHAGFVAAEKRAVVFAGAREEFGLLPAAVSPSGDGRLTGLVPVFVSASGFAAAWREQNPALVVATWESLANPDATPALREFVGRGGNLLVLPAANGVGAGTAAPAWLGMGPESLQTIEKGALVLPFNAGAAVFADLRDRKGEVPLRSVKAFKFQALKLADKGAALMGLEDGRALVAGRALGRGNLFASGMALDPEWTSLPLKSGFVALVQSMALAGGEAGDTVAPLAAGERMPGTNVGNIEIRTVAGGVIEWKGGFDARPAFPRSGVFAVQSGSHVSRVAVRASALEGDRKFVTGQTVPALAAVPHTIRTFSDQASLAGEAKKMQTSLDLFLPLLLLAFACLAAEGILANQPPRKAGAVQTATA